jgi:hypothetical protein
MTTITTLDETAKVLLSPKRTCIPRYITFEKQGYHKTQTPANASNGRQYTANSKQQAANVETSLQKVFCHHFLALLSLLLLSMHVVLWRGIEDVEEALSIVADFEHTGHVSASVTVVRSAPYSAQSVVIQHLISFLTELVGSQNMRHVVDLEKLLDHLGTKRVARSARTQAELVSFGVWVAPDQVCHGPFVRNLPEAVNDLDLVNAVDAGRKAAVYAEDLVVNHHREREVVEHVGKIVPDISIAVFPTAFGVEAVRLRHATGLVVTADEMDAMWIAELEADEERYCFNAEKTAVDIVSCSVGLEIRSSRGQVCRFQDVPRKR